METSLMLVFLIKIKYAFCQTSIIYTVAFFSKLVILVIDAENF
jgi:hypothetical protein